MSVSVIDDSEAEMFSDATVNELMELSRVLVWVAPSSALVDVMSEIAWSMMSRASCAPSAVVTSMSARVLPITAPIPRLEDDVEAMLTSLVWPE